jgi:hypothetical protein
MDRKDGVKESESSGTMLAHLIYRWWYQFIQMFSAGSAAWLTPSSIRIGCDPQRAEEEFHAKRSYGSFRPGVHCDFFARDLDALSRREGQVHQMHESSGQGFTLSRCKRSLCEVREAGLKARLVRT